MSDPADIGNDRMQEIIDDGIIKSRIAPKPEPGVGVCLNCAAILEDDRRWCDNACRDDWESRQRKTYDVA
jgi:hypothetical protein